VDSLSPATEPAATTAIPVTNASNASGEDASPGVTYLRAILNRLFEKVSECPSDRHVLCLGEFTKLVSVDAQFATDLLARVEKAASLCSKHSGRFVMVLTVEASLPSKTSGLFLDGIPLMDMGDGRRRMRGGDDSHMRNPDSLFSDSMRGLSSTGAMTIFSVGAVPSGEDGESKDNDSSRESRRAGRLQSIKQIEKVFTTKIKLHAPSAEVTGPRGATSTSLRRWQEVVEKDARMLRFLVVSKLLTRTAASIGVTVTEAALNVLKADKYAKDQLLRTAAVEKILAWSLAFANSRPSTSQTELTDAAETLTDASSNYDTAVTTIDESHMVQALALYDRLKSTKGSSFITTTSSAASSSGDPSLQSAVHRLKNRDEIGTLCDNDFERRLITDIVLPHEIDTSFDDIGALDNVKTTMNELILLPLKRPELFRRGTLSKPTKGLLLFGPPGTGKTMLARALAHGADAAFMSISMASIGSKWFGDGERMVQAVFSLAKKLAPCIIFVDEVDAMLSQRSSSGKGDNNEHEAMRKIKNEFMMQWDGLKSSEADRIVVVGATNRPFDLDDAVLRRMPRRLLVDLPGPEQREAILRIMLKDDMKENALSPEVNLSAVAAETAGYSGSDLRAVCIAAAYRPIQELLRNEKADGRTREASELRQVTQEDFLAALREIAPSLHESTAAVASLREWNEMFGEGGSRNKKTLSYFM
jgi:SpoVK/Ycf46/Vps4 family AAA+-type ATPase